MGPPECRTINPGGSRRVVVTKELPGERWLRLLADADCRIDICTSSEPLSPDHIRSTFAGGCVAAIGQLTETWDGPTLTALRDAGALAYSNYAVGYDNVDMATATRLGLPVGNTPGILTETTAELAVALTFAAARRITEGDQFMREGHYTGWLPTLLLGRLLWHRTVGIIGAGRIGMAYARMLVEGHKMDVIYFDPARNEALEEYVADYSRFLQAHGRKPVRCRRAQSVEEVLEQADVVSLHAILGDSTRHLISGPRLALMKDDAILINSSRGPLIDEAALVEHCRTHPRFRAGLDVYEHEPAMQAGLVDLPNVVIVPHLGSATSWTRQGMATLAAANVVAILNQWPVWGSAEVRPFLTDPAPQAAPSIINAADLGLPVLPDTAGPA